MILSSSNQTSKWRPTMSRWVRQLQDAPVCSAYGCPKARWSARQLLVLEDVPDDRVDGDVRPHRELADAVGILLGRGCRPRSLRGSRCARMHVRDSAVLDPHGQRVLLDVPVPRAEVVAQDAVDDVHAVHPRGGGQHFAARQVRPLSGVMRPLVFSHRIAGSNVASRSLPPAISPESAASRWPGPGPGC